MGVDHAGKNVNAYLLVGREQRADLRSCSLIIIVGFAEEEWAAHQGDSDAVLVAIGRGIGIEWIDHIYVLDCALKFEQVAVVGDFPEIFEHRGWAVGGAAGEHRFAVLEIHAAEFAAVEISKALSDLGDIPVDADLVIMAVDEATNFTHKSVDSLATVEHSKVKFEGNEAACLRVAFKVLKGDGLRRHP